MSGLVFLGVLDVLTFLFESQPFLRSTATRNDNDPSRGLPICGECDTLTPLAKQFNNTRRWVGWAHGVGLFNEGG
jgi:hypothetical protein